MTRMLTALSLSLILSAMAGCGARDHTDKHFGERTRRYFRVQRIYALPVTESPGGLDSEEAALIQAAYRKQMGGEDLASQADDAPTRVLLLKDPEPKK